MKKTKPTTKPAAKAVAKKVVAKPTAPKPVVKDPEFNITVSMNGEVYMCSTDDLKSALLELSPKVFKTKVVINVANKFDSIERVMMIQRAKQIFRSEMALDVFIKNVLLGLKNG